jgi:RNA polymerase sigma-70 factor, ECF subfamily
LDQRSLVERAQKGDHDAFATLARAAVVRLGPAARLIVRDPELARDAVQDAFISAWRDLPGLRDPDRFDAVARRNADRRLGTRADPPATIPNDW